MWKFLLAMLAVCWSVPAWALCDCSRPTVAVAAKTTHLEVWGEATRVVPAAAGYLVRFDVHETNFDEHGKNPTRIVLQDPRTCGVGFKEGETYLVRAMESRSGDNLYLTNTCAGSYPSAAPPSELDDVAGKLEPREGERSQLVRGAVNAARECKEEAKSNPFEPFVLMTRPEDDPWVAGPTKRCVGPRLLPLVAHMTTDEPSVVSGSVLFETLSASIDLWTCSPPGDCVAYSSVMRPRLLEVMPPLSESQARTLARQMHAVTDRDPSVEIARTLCRLDGVDAAEKFARNNKLVGGPRWNAEMEAMLFECTVATRDFDRARVLLQTAQPGPAFAIAFNWFSSKERESFPVRTEAPTLLDAQEEPAIMVRRTFALTTMWENDVLMLEAFAEAVAGDADAPTEVRKLGALAYHKAALLEPAAAASYQKFARELATDDELGETLNQLRTNFEQAVRANEARASLAERAAAEPIEQLDLAETQTKQKQNTHRAPVLKDEEQELDLDWGSLALHLLVIVGALSVVAFLASRGSRRRR